MEQTSTASRQHLGLVPLPPFGMVSPQHLPFGMVSPQHLPFGIVLSQHLPFRLVLPLHLPFGMVSPQHLPFGMVLPQHLPFGMVSPQHFPFGMVLLQHLLKVLQCRTHQPCAPLWYWCPCWDQSHCRRSHHGPMTPQLLGCWPAVAPGGAAHANPNPAQTPPPSPHREQWHPFLPVIHSWIGYSHQIDSIHAR